MKPITLAGLALALAANTACATAVEPEVDLETGDDDALVHYRSPTWRAQMTPPLSAMVAHDDLLHLAGMLGFGSDGGLADGVQAQTRFALEAIEATLAQVGADRSDIVSCTAYLADMGDYATFNDAYAAFFAPPYPARTTIGVAALPLGAAVEITCLAARPEGD